MKHIYFKNTVAAGTSLLTIVAPKFCCWSSAFAAISGGVSYLAWVYPMRPYLYVLSSVLIGFSFYQSYGSFKKKAGNVDNCQVCQAGKQISFNTKYITWLAAIFVLVMFLTSYF